MASATIFGDGNMGTAIGQVLTAGGATVDHITTENSGAPITGDIVVLAVPHPAVEAILAQYADQLAGKIVVDITNPLDFATFDGLVVPADGSKAHEIAATLPAGVGYTSIEIKVNYVRSVHADDGELVAHGRVTKPGRRVAFAEGDVRNLGGKVVATASGSCLVISGR